VEQVLRDIAALERRLGYRLFEEPAAQARLTQAGRKTAQAMMTLTQEPAAGPITPDAVAVPLAAPPIPPAPEPSRRTIILAAPAPVFGKFQDALAAFEAANEDIAIALDLHVSDARDAADALAGGRADIAYFYAIDEPADLMSRYGWSEPLNLYVGDAHPLARSDSVSRAALSITPALMTEAGGGLRRVIDAALRRGRADLAPPVLESDNMVDIIAALRDGAGCFPAFGTLARDLGRMPGVRRLALDMPLPPVDIRQAIGPDAASKPGVEALADFLFL
jgi:DNA-binding transcriptional LysR family regulator